MAKPMMAERFGYAVDSVLGAAWADDTPIPFVGFTCQKCFEVYSGNTDPDLTGGVDETPEGILIGRDQVVRWSVMQAGTANNFGGYSNPRFAYSIEEVVTIDFRNIPSKER